MADLSQTEIQEAVRQLTRTPERYLAALERFRNQIATGEELTFFDDETIGNKHTHCAWGLCSESLKSWPDREDHLFQDDFDRYKRVSPKYGGLGQHCPFDKDQSETTEPWGCFYRCMIFQAARGKVPTKEKALELYDLSIERVKQRASGPKNNEGLPNTTA